jgi:hypothetical protein
MKEERAAIILARIRGMLDAAEVENDEGDEDEEEGVQRHKRKQRRKRREEREEREEGVSLDDRIKAIKAKL